MDWNERLNRWADAMERTAEKVTDFGAAEVPEYMREVILWEIIGNAMSAVALLAVMIAAGLAVRHGVRRDMRDDGGDGIPFWMFGSMVLFPATLFFCLHTSQAVKAAVAPRVVIVEKVAELAKGVRK